MNRSSLLLVTTVMTGLACSPKLFARQYGAYVDVTCPLATCANIWTGEILEHARKTRAIGTALLEAHAEGLIDIDVRKLPTG